MERVHRRRERPFPAVAEKTAALLANVARAVLDAEEEAQMEELEPASGESLYEWTPQDDKAGVLDKMLPLEYQIEEEEGLGLENVRRGWSASGEGMP